MPDKNVSYQTEVTVFVQANHQSESNQGRIERRTREAMVTHYLGTADPNTKTEFGFDKPARLDMFLPVRGLRQHYYYGFILTFTLNMSAVVEDTLSPKKVLKFFEDWLVTGQHIQNQHADIILLGHNPTNIKV